MYLEYLWSILGWPIVALAGVVIISVIVGLIVSYAVRDYILAIVGLTSLSTVLGFSCYYMSEGFVQDNPIKCFAFLILIIIICVTIVRKIFGNDSLGWEFENTKQRVLALLLCMTLVVPYFFIFSAIDSKIDQNSEVIYQRIEEYQSKIIKTEENNVVVSEEARTLTYFNNIPISNISGSISGSSILGNGSVHGNISTTDVIPYWYLDGNDSLYGSTPAQNSVLRVCPEDKQPYLEIKNYCNRTKTYNGNTNEESYHVTASWTEYVFYLPKELVEGQFNN